MSTRSQTGGSSIAANVLNLPQTISLNHWRWAVILFGRLELSSLRETPPSVREMKKQHLVPTMWDPLCQPEALGAIAPTLYWTHMAARTTRIEVPTNRRNALAPVRFRHG